MPLYELDGVRPKTPSSGLFWVADSAAVIGRATLGEDTGIWFNAVIRADNEPIEIGAHTNVQENCVLHVDPGFPITIGESCTIGHKVVLHGCTIGRGCLIGMGAIILNGASIGDEALIGAGAIVTEGKEIPPRSLVIGAPGKVVRQLTDDEVNRIQRSAETYSKRWKQYRSGLVRL